MTPTPEQWETHIRGTIGYGINREVEIEEVVKTVKSSLQNQASQLLSEVEAIIEAETYGIGDPMTGFRDVCDADDLQQQLSLLRSKWEKE